MRYHFFGDGLILSAGNLQEQFDLTSRLSSDQENQYQQKRNLRANQEQANPCADKSSSVSLLLE